jgi:hypothetical protein
VLATALSTCLLAAAALASPLARTQQQAEVCRSGVLNSGGRYFIAVPEGWDAAEDSMLVLAPGYSFIDRPIDAPPEIGPVELAPLRSLGLAVAVVGYRKLGLAVKQGVQDV